MLYQSIHSDVLHSLADFISGLKIPSIISAFLNQKFNLNLAMVQMTP